jgi:IS30 family transposase
MAGDALSLFEREEIRAGLERGDSCAEIARTIRRDPSTVTREVARNGGSNAYVAIDAEERARRCRARPKQPKLLADRRLAKAVSDDLHRGYSPAGVAVRLRQAGGATVSHETIYQAIYSPTFRGISMQGQHCLRTRRRRRRPRCRERIPADRAKFGDFKLIELRPRGAADRSEPGHWEGDLIIGARHRSAVVTLVERTSRFTVLAAVEGSHTAPAIRAALQRAFAGVPAVMRASLTWDQGGEISHWADIEDDLGLDVYLCHPQAPWERPSNENTNRQLRFWFPKGTDLSRHSQADLDRVAHVLNTTPRRLFGWGTAAQTYARLTDALTG